MGWERVKEMVAMVRGTWEKMGKVERVAPGAVAIKGDAGTVGGAPGRVMAAAPVTAARAVVTGSVKATVGEVAVMEAKVVAAPEAVVRAAALAVTVEDAAAHEGMGSGASVGTDDGTTASVKHHAVIY